MTNATPSDTQDTPPKAARPAFEPRYSPVMQLTILLTEDCNLRCDYCFVKKTPRRMSAETARKTVDFYFDRNISGLEQTVTITFFGGEPMLELERMAEIIARARERARPARKNPRFSATTNGTMATPEVERIVRDASMALLISLDGAPDDNAHRPFISGRPSYQAVARNLPKLVSWAPFSAVRMTYHPEALNLVRNVQHVLELGAPLVALCPVDESPWHRHQQRLEAAYEELADWFIAEARRGYLVPLEITHLHLRHLHAVRHHGAGRPTRPCMVGTSMLGIDPDGHVMPCHRFLYRPQDWFGHVDTPELPPERWKYVHLSSEALLGCNTCSARMLCGGGCRLVVVESGGDLETGTAPGYCLTTRAHVRAATTIYDTLMAEQNPLLLDMLQSTVAPERAALTSLAIQ